MYVALDTHFGANRNSPEYRAITSAMMNYQTDPELERVRREVWSQYGQFVPWAIGFQVLCLVAANVVLPCSDLSSYSAGI